MIAELLARGAIAHLLGKVPAAELARAVVCAGVRLPRLRRSDPRQRVLAELRREMRGGLASSSCWWGIVARVRVEAVS